MNEKATPLQIAVARGDGEMELIRLAKRNGFDPRDVYEDIGHQPSPEQIKLASSVRPDGSRLKILKK